MLRLSLFILLFAFTNLQAITVLIAKESIKYEEKLNTSKLRLVNVNKIKKSCIPLTLANVQNNEFRTTHYINRNSIICQKDVKIYENNSVLFNFGALQIEKKGQIVFENEKFIRIKKDNGKIEKIYKDGRLK